MLHIENLLYHPLTLLSLRVVNLHVKFNLKKISLESMEYASCFLFQNSYNLHHEHQLIRLMI